MRVQASPLRAALDAAIADRGGSMKDLTVLASQRDPFRLDTPANHRLGEWLAAEIDGLGLGERGIHLRGLHYRLLGRPMPDGTPYVNTDACWEWLSEKAAKAGRWLGYVPFAQIIDQRITTEPVIREFSRAAPYPSLSTDLEVSTPDGPVLLEIPADIDTEPYLGLLGLRAVQPVRLVLIGEKSSLGDELGPLARLYEADLYLPTGEMSDTLIYRIAVTAARDGRPLVVLYFADCDPAGHQMIVSVTRKLQALKLLVPGMPEFQTRRAALTPAQVGEYGLPSTPLKETERRADKWLQAFGVEQTEVDALTARPGLLAQLAREAIEPFYDRTLPQRVADYREEWTERAWEAIGAVFDLDDHAETRRYAEEQLARMRREILDLNDDLRIDFDPAILPEIEAPEAAEPEDDGLPLLDSRWDFAEQCRALIDSKAYRDGGEEP